MVVDGQVLRDEDGEADEVEASDCRPEPYGSRERGRRPESHPLSSQNVTLTQLTRELPDSMDKRIEINLNAMMKGEEEGKHGNYSQ